MRNREKAEATLAGRSANAAVVAYASAAILAMAAEGLRQALTSTPAGAPASLLLFLHFPAVLAAALWLGFGPGLACVAIATLLIAWSMPPEASLRVEDRRDLLTLAMFTGSAALVCALVERMRRGRKLVPMLQDREARLEAILDTAAGGILTIDERGIVESMNPAAERMFGYSAADVLGRNVSLLMPRPYRDEHDGYLANYLSTGNKKIIGIGREVTGQRKDGTTFPIHLAVSEVPLVGQRLFTGFISDLSAQKKLEHEFLQAQKLEAVGSLAGGIAHDFNNLLMGIMACSRMAAADLDPRSSVRGLFDEIGSAASRGIALTRRLLAFSRRQPVDLRPTSINGVVRENETMLRQLLGEDVALRVDLAASGAIVHADEGLVEQVLINLLVNARDAMPHGGEIAVTTGETTDEVALDVRDTGCGMTSEVQARIFEPFFSTKGPEKGTGLGLSTVQRIVAQLGGKIAVESAVGKGTTFRLTFPRVELAAKEVTPFAPRPAATPGGRIVLVVEDDRLVRSSLCMFLERKGYRVLAADNGSRAETFAAEASIDVLLTDIVLPDASGNELADKIRARTPRIHVVFMSAHPAETLIQSGRLAAGALYLEKPFEMEALEDVLARIFAPVTSVT